MSEEYNNNMNTGNTDYNEVTEDGENGFVISNFKPHEEEQKKEYTRFNTYKESEFKTDFKPEKPKKTRKPNCFVKRAACFVLAAAVFGSIAGGTMVGINYAAQKAGVVASSDSSAASKVQQAQTVTPTSTTSSDGTSVMDVSAVVKNVMPTVVAITNSQVYKQYSTSPYDFYQYFFGGGYSGNDGKSGKSGKSGSSSGDQQYQEVGAGSGIIVDKNDKELIIVTNNHVIEDADELTITFADNKTAKASVKGTDSDTDLAVVSVKLSDLSDDTLSAIKTATIGSSDDLAVGQGVIAIGNALGYGQSVTVGYVSALNRTIQTEENVNRTVIQTDAAINPGNSGGALINTKGELIGINCAKYSDTDVEGVGYAIPISLASSIIDNLKTKTTKEEVTNVNEQGYLGINAATIDSQSAAAYGMPAGVYVASITENGPASKSDLKEKDIITALDGEKLSTNQDLVDLLKYYKGGTEVELTVNTLENGSYKEHKVKVTLGYAKDKPQTTNSNQ